MISDLMGAALTGHAAMVAVAACTYGPGILYSALTWRQMKACGGLKPWRDGGYGCALPGEREAITRETRDVLTDIETAGDDSLPGCAPWHPQPSPHDDERHDGHA